MRISKRTTVAAAVVAAAALVLTACGDDGDSGGSKAKKTVKISLIAPVGTPTANFVQVVASARAAAKAINDAGGLPGEVNVEIDFCNEQNNVNKAAECARKAEASQDIATVSAFSTFAPQSLLPNFKTIPNVAPIGITPAEVNCDNCYPIDATPVASYAAQGPYLAMNGAKTVTLVSYDIPAAKSNAEGAKHALEQARLKVDIIYVPVTTSNWAPVAQRFKRNGSDAFVPVLPNQQTVAFLQAAKQAGLKFTISVVDGQIFRKDLPSLGSFANGMLVTAAFPPLSAKDRFPALAKWAAEVKAFGGAGTSEQELDGSALRAWLGVHTIANIAKTITGEINRTSFSTAFKAAKDVDLQGILPKWTPAKAGPVPTLKHINNPYTFFLKVENNDLVLTNPKAWAVFQGKFVDPATGK